MTDKPRPASDGSFSVLPLRDTVLFPRALPPLTFGPSPTLKALEGLDGNDIVVVVAQRESKKEAVTRGDPYNVGVTERARRPCFRDRCATAL